MIVDTAYSPFSPPRTFEFRAFRTGYTHPSGSHIRIGLYKNGSSEPVGSWSIEEYNSIRRASLMLPSTLVQDLMKREASRAAKNALIRQEIEELHRKISSLNKELANYL